VIEQVRKTGLDAVVVFACHDDDGVRLFDGLCHALEWLGRLSSWKLLVHAIEQWDLELERVEERDVMAALAQALNDVARGPDALTLRANRAVYDDHAHDGLICEPL
jgi:hypothetical protein